MIESVCRTCDTEIVSMIDVLLVHATEDEIRTAGVWPHRGTDGDQFRVDIWLHNSETNELDLDHLPVPCPHMQGDTTYPPAEGE